MNISAQSKTSIFFIKASGNSAILFRFVFYLAKCEREEILKSIFGAIFSHANKLAYGLAMGGQTMGLQVHVSRQEP